MFNGVLEIKTETSVLEWQADHCTWLPVLLKLDLRLFPIYDIYDISGTPLTDMY